MAQSLLAHLYSRIKGSQEDVATYSLQYILSQSEHLNSRFNRLMAGRLGIEAENLNYTCQVVGDNKERPDLSGKDSYGNEKILCEAKFYAGLTDNQPNTYIDRLLSEQGNGLVFICPKARLISLWGKLHDLCKQRSIVELSPWCVSVDDMHMSIVSWDELLEELHETAAAVAPSSLADIDQLVGFCAEMDSTAFIPFSCEDLGPDIARSIERYSDVIDAVFDKLMADKSLQPSAQKLKASPFRHGYSRYIRILGFGVCIKYDRILWMKSIAETPFWMHICIIENGHWKDMPVSMFEYVDPKDKYCSDSIVDIALHAPVYTTLDEIATAIKEEVVNRIQVINCNNPF